MSQLAKQPVITGPDDAYRYLRRRIIDFTLLPGEFLSENALAAQMGTSRATVREAIARLAEEGCVEVFPQRGTQVNRISINRLRHAVFLRTVLEESVLRRHVASAENDEITLCHHLLHIRCCATIEQVVALELKAHLLKRLPHAAGAMLAEPHIIRLGRDKNTTNGIGKRPSQVLQKAVGWIDSSVHGYAGTACQEILHGRNFL